MKTQRVIEILNQDPCVDSVELQDGGEVAFWLTGPTGCDPDGSDTEDFDYDSIHQLSQTTLLRLNQLLGVGKWDIMSNDCPGYYNENVLTIE